MSDLKSAAKLALEAFKEIADETYDSWTNGAKAQRIAQAMIPKLEEALAKPEQGEPVARLKLMMEESAFEGRLELSDALLNIDEFYTTPPQSEARGLSQQQRKPLTVNEICNMVARISDVRNPYMQFARAIEAAHGIKE